MMEMIPQVFNWLAAMGIMQDGYIAKKKKTAIVLTQQATNAVMSGHVFYYVCYNISYNAGIQLTQTLTGVPGEPVAPQIAHYNWSVVADILGNMGHGLDADARHLLANGDSSMLLDLLYDIHGKYSGEPTVSKGKSGRTSVLTAVNMREGAVSVDVGMDRLKKKQAEEEERLRPRKFDVRDDLERIKHKRELRLQKEQEVAERKRQEEERAAEVRARIREQLNWTRQRADDVGMAEVLPVYREFTNRGDVQFCHNLILSIVDDVESGAAQQRLAQKEKARQMARKAAKERAKKDSRLMDTKAPITIPKENAKDRKTVLMCLELLLEHCVYPALTPGIKDQLAEREAMRNRDKKAQQKTMKRLVAQRDDRVNKKHREALKDIEDAKRKKEIERKKKYDIERRLNEERAMKVAAEVEEKRLEKLAKEEIERERKAKKEAEAALYYAEQKSKVIELQRRRAMKKEADEERKRQEEHMSREDRRQRGMELNKKLQDKERNALEARSKSIEAPPSLSPVNMGTGEHASYFGETLGWQYLTEVEFDLATMFGQVRAEPESAIPWIEQRIDDIELSKTMWFTDESGKRHPMCLSGEGMSSHLDCKSFLQKQKSVKPLDDISIGLTLAARQHAIDLAYHGIANSEQHTGSDGSSVSQRILKYGAPAIRPGHAEIIMAFVHPDSLRLNASTMLSQLLVDAEDPQRTNRLALFNPTMVESVGVGHAVASCKGGFVVEVAIMIIAYSFVDKPVAWMSQALYNGVGAVAEDFVRGNRRCHPKIKNKKDLFTTENIIIGQMAKAANYEKLAAETLRRKQYNAPVVQPVEESPPPKPKPKKKKNPTPQPAADTPAPSPASTEEASPSQEVSPNQKKKLTAKEKKEANRVRLVRFYTKHAPHKLSIVDAALTMYEGREDEMFFTLIRKYGAEPHPDEELPDPEEAMRQAEEAEATKNAERERKQREKREREAAAAAAAKKEAEERKKQQEAERAARKKKSPSPAPKKPSPEPEPEKEEAPQKEEPAPLEKKSTLKSKKEREIQSAREAEQQQREQQLEEEKSVNKEDSNVTQEASVRKEPSTDVQQSESTTVEKEPSKELPADDNNASAENSDVQKESSASPSQSGTMEQSTRQEQEERKEDADNEREPHQQPAPAAEEPSPAPSPAKEESKKDLSESQSSPTNRRNNTSSVRFADQEDEKKDEEIAPSTTKEADAKPGPASTEETSSEPPGRDRRTRLVAMYVKYAPDKLANVDATLERYSALSDEALIDALVRKYGPEPTAEEVREIKEQRKAMRSSGSAAGLMGRNSTFAGITPTNTGDQPAEVKTDVGSVARYAQYKQRLTRMYTKYCPEKVPHVDKLLTAYQGKELAMFLALKKKYGPEPSREEVPLDGDDEIEPMDDEGKDPDTDGGWQ